MELCTNVPDVCFKDSISLMSAVPNVAVGEGGVMRYLPPYSVEGYISRYISRVDLRWFAMMPVGHTLTVKVGNEERETAYAS